VGSLSEGFVNLDVALPHPNDIAHFPETNSNGYCGVNTAAMP
jgi:hypothetical protein